MIFIIKLIAIVLIIFKLISLHKETSFLKGDRASKPFWWIVGLIAIWAIADIIDFLKFW